MNGILVLTKTNFIRIREYAKGGELVDYIAARDHLSEKEARKFFRQIISAIDHCHLASVVHRDLKLDNLLLNADKNVLLSDFGLGRTFNPDAKEYMKVFFYIVLVIIPSNTDLSNK